MELFSTKGGTALGGAIEAFAQTPEGQKVLEAFGVNTSAISKPTTSVTAKPRKKVSTSKPTPSA